MESTFTVLTVDDDHEIRSLLADYLGANGYATLEAQDGISMEKVLDSHRVDLIVLDLNMPGEDGLSLCRKLRSRSAMYGRDRPRFDHCTQHCATTWRRYNAGQSSERRFGNDADLARQAGNGPISAKRRRHPSTDRTEHRYRV
jgi:hypothetical protein